MLSTPMIIHLGMLPLVWFAQIINLKETLDYMNGKRYGAYGFILLPSIFLDVYIAFFLPTAILWFIFVYFKYKVNYFRIMHFRIKYVLKKFLQ